MPRPHVHFATSRSRSGPPPLSSSPSSSPRSSRGPHTPPDVVYLSLPHSKSAGHHHRHHTPTGRPHTLLAHSTVPLLTYDLRLAPVAGNLSTPYPHGISGHMLAEPAISPPQRSLTLTGAHLGLPWVISVSASSNGQYVSVGDVLEGLYRALRTPVRAAEYAELGRRRGGSTVMDGMARTYKRRCRLYRDRRAYEEEQRGGLRGVDYLMGYTKFAGLSPTSRGADVWEIETMGWS
ncbi:hypothetical protein HMN09_00849600 [Mycena chlorophos]|uniref:DUF6699 domain-containing protein n=1 Tax=Mycena chlorophos TaxID=658473 RepID=A0A8H6W7F9_MYCCL|nr:hypothetical protein HMN09_00849600 [Mycena chlorophos]